MEKSAFWSGFRKAIADPNLAPYTYAAIGGATGGAIDGVAAHFSTKHKNNGTPYANFYRNQKKKNPKLTDEQIKKKFVRSAVALGVIGGAALGAMHGFEAKTTHKFWNDFEHEDFFHRRGGGYSQSKPGSSFGKRTVDKLKEVLGVPVNVTKKTDVRKAFMDAAKKHHPDRGGTTEAMQNVNDAWSEIQNTDWFEKLSWLTTGAGKGVLERSGAESSRDAEEGVADSEGNDAIANATQLFDRERNPKSHDPFKLDNSDFEQEDGAHVKY